MKDLEEIIAKHVLLQEFEPDTIKLIAGCAKNVVFDAGETIATEGSPADFFYLIRSGKVAVQTFVPNRGPIILQTIGPEDIMGWSWLFPPYKWCYDIKAVEQTRTIAFDGRCLRQKCEEDHDLGYQLMKRFSQVMVRRLQATRMQVLDVYQSLPAQA